MGRLRCYGDESGLHDEAPCFVLAGWIAHEEEWVSFELRWRDALRGHGVPDDVPFHMTDCEGGYREYKGWSREKRTALVTDLADVLLATKAFGVGTVIDRRKAATAGLGGHWFAVEPYSAAFPRFLGAACIPWSVFFGAEERVDFVMDRQEVFADSTLTLFKDQVEAKDPLLDRCGELRFANAADYGALQAADLLAFELRKDSEAIADGGTRPMRRLLRRLTESGRVAAIDITSEAEKLNLLLRDKWERDGGLTVREGRRPGSSKKRFFPREPGSGKSG